MRHRILFSHLIFALSGLAGLGYQIVWARQFSVGLGHEVPSVFAVIVAFFGGLAIGAWMLDGPIGRSRHPDRWYAALEFIIAGWALVTIALVPIVNDFASQRIGLDPSPIAHWTWAMVLPFVTLLPATVAMGATLPALERFVAAVRSRGRVVAGLYAANTLGAAVGVLMAAFLLLPNLGVMWSMITLAAMNLLCAAGILIVRPPGGPIEPPTITPIVDGIGRVRLGVTLFLTGALGIGYEVLGVRVMAQVLQNTVYSFACALSVYLIFTSLGAAIYHRHWREQPFRPLLTSLIIGLSSTCLLGIMVLARGPELHLMFQNAIGGGFTGAIIAEMIFAMLVFAAPSFFMGAIFSHLVEAAKHQGGGVGRAIGLNTFGGMAGPILFGIVLLPLTGARNAIALLALAYLFLIPERRPARLLPAVVPVVLLLLLPPHLVLVTTAPDGRVLEYREGLLGAVAIVEDANRNRALKVNNHFDMGSTVSLFLEQRLAHLPLFLHPDPERALFLGVGTGITMGAASIEPHIELTGVELVPEIIDVMHWFDPANAGVQNAPHATIHAADARRYVRASTHEYDVIVADLYHPARDGAGSLYTTEHFRAIRDRLAPEGIFCQWLPVYQLDEKMLRVIIRTFLDVYPDGFAIMASYNAETPCLGLIGSRSAVTFDSTWFERRVVERDLIEPLQQRRQALYTPFALFGTVIGDADGLRRYAGEGPRNTDQFPIVIHGAPRYAYAPQRAPHEQMRVLLERTDGSIASLFPDRDADEVRFTERLSAVHEARDLYLRGEAHRVENRPIDALALYIESAAVSSDFETSYAMALRVATDLARAGDEEIARTAFRALRDARPDRPEAEDRLRTLGQ
ncbi:MAG: spermidine synthase [Phycisphaerales bacterium]|nr:MAG: spermidine synthase [Phycisphaerales bacterium]